MRSILTLSSLALLLLLAIATAHAQCTNTADGNFTLPAWGSDRNYQKYGQYVPASPGLTGDRLWQISLCQTATNVACQNGNTKAPVSYIYQLNRNDGSAGSCDMGLSLFGGWSTSYALDNNGNLVTSLNGTFTNAALNRVAVVALICGTSALTPVTYPGQPNQWYTYSNSAQSVWTWDIVFSTNAIPSLCGNNPPPPPNPTPNPPPPPPAPAGTCQLNGAYFKLPSFNGTVQQWVPSAPELNGARNWQVSPCAPTLPTCNPTNGNVIESFVFESTPSTGTCSMQLNVQATNWTQAYGGINALFTNLAGNRVANVTVSCGPIAELQAVDTAPSGQGWNTHLLPNSVGQVWVWDMWFSSSLVPGC